MKHKTFDLIILCGFLVMLYYVCKTPNTIEGFAVQFGTPHETTDTDHEHIKTLLEVGSQSHENTKYDVVSTHYLGDIARPAPPPPPPPPPDPVCFQGDDYDGERIDFDKQSDCCTKILNK